MQNIQIEEKLKGLLKEIDDGIDTDAVCEESRLKEDVGLSSVAMIYMAVSIENEFGIDLQNEDMGALKTVGDVVRLIEHCLC